MRFPQSVRPPGSITCVHHWQVDGISGQRFRDPRDPNQLTFDIFETDCRPLKDSILALLEERERSLADLRRHALLKTIYKEAHANAAVDALVEKGTTEQVSTGRSHAERVFRRAQRRSRERSGRPTPDQQSHTRRLPLLAFSGKW